MRRRRRRRKNTRRASNKDSEIFAGQLFSCPVFSREDEDRRRRPRPARECSKTHSVLSPLSPGSNFIFTQVSGSDLPVFFIQNFYCYRKQPPSCTHMRAKRRLSYDRLSYILIQLYFRYPVAKSTTFRYGVPFAHAARFSPAILTIRSNVSGRKKFPAT